MYWQCKDFKISRPPEMVKVANIQVKTPDEQLQKGKFYWDGNSECGKTHKAKVLDLVDKALKEKSQLIILPELSTSFDIEKQITKKIKKQNNDCIVVCGSYYYKRKHYSPILCKINSAFEVVYQRKLHSSQNEKNFMDEGNTLNILWNTGLGDIAVIICYDAYNWKIFKDLQDLVDVVVVIAYNKSLRKFQNLFTISCQQHYYSIILCNDAKYGDSSMFIPCQQTSKSQFSYQTIPAKGYTKRKNWSPPFIFWKKHFLGLEKNWEGISVFNLNIGALDRMRCAEKGLREEIENRKLAYPPSNIKQSRYVADRRTIDFFYRTVKQITTEFLPANITPFLVYNKQLYRIDKEVVKIGSHPTNSDICLTGDSIYQNHAVILFRNNEFYIFASESSQNIYVNDIKVNFQWNPSNLYLNTDGELLKQGSQIKLSEDVLLQFQCPSPELLKDLETLIGKPDERPSVGEFITVLSQYKKTADSGKKNIESESIIQDLKKYTKQRNRKIIILQKLSIVTLVIVSVLFAVKKTLSASISISPIIPEQIYANKEIPISWTPIDLKCQITIMHHNKIAWQSLEELDSAKIKLPASNQPYTLILTHKKQEFITNFTVDPSLILKEEQTKNKSKQTSEVDQEKKNVAKKFISIFLPSNILKNKIFSPEWKPKIKAYITILKQGKTVWKSKEPIEPGKAQIQLLTGEYVIELDNGSNKINKNFMVKNVKYKHPIKVSFLHKKEKKDFPLKADDVLFCGWRLKIEIDVLKKSYVYGLHRDSQGNIEQFFPGKEQQPLTIGKYNFPGRTSFIKLNQQKGKEHFYFIYSRFALVDLNKILPVYVEKKKNILHFTFQRK